MVLRSSHLPRRAPCLVILATTLLSLLPAATAHSQPVTARRAVLLFIVDGLQNDAAKVAMANGAVNIRFFFDNGVWVEEAYCSSPSGRLYLPDNSTPWGTSAPPNVAMHTGTHIFESRQMDDVFLAARRANIVSLFSGSADNYRVFNTADYCYAVSNTDSIVVDFAINHLRKNNARHLSLHVQETRRNWTGPEDKTKPDSKYQRYLLHVDYLLGKLIQALKSEGIWDSTFVIVSSDHGMGMTKQSDHPASVISSWQPYMNFYGPGNKRGKTIPYAETPDIDIMIAHWL
ncbi:MAG: alkaline phosphatase family protein, partial [Ignavibacteria bacterium]|nr:alkaline phosphatase family protein [Ignavibacteria bacterium]